MRIWFFKIIYWNKRDFIQIIKSLNIVRVYAFSFTQILVKLIIFKMVFKTLSYNTRLILIHSIKRLYSFTVSKGILYIVFILPTNEFNGVKPNLRCCFAKFILSPPFSVVPFLLIE